MSDPDKPEQLLAPPPPSPSGDPFGARPIMANPGITPGRDRFDVRPEVVMGNPKGSIGGVRDPVVRLGLVIALLATIAFAVWRFVL